MARADATRGVLPQSTVIPIVSPGTHGGGKSRSLKKANSSRGRGTSKYGRKQTIIIPSETTKRICCFSGKMHVSYPLTLGTRLTQLYLAMYAHFLVPIFVVSVGNGCFGYNFNTREYAQDRVEAASLACRKFDAGARCSLVNNIYFSLLPGICRLTTRVLHD